MQDSKECFKCNILKPLGEFYKHRMMKDGHLNKCIECAKIDENIRRKNNIEAIRAYDRERGRLPHRLILSVDITKRLRARITGYTMSHSAVARAVKNGVLIRKPCCMCGSIMSVAHHDDYSMPLDVMWLCTIHHKSRHSFLAYNLQIGL